MSGFSFGTATPATTSGFSFGAKAAPATSTVTFGGFGSTPASSTGTSLFGAGTGASAGFGGFGSAFGAFGATKTTGTTTFGKLQVIARELRDSLLLETTVYFGIFWGEGGGGFISDSILETLNSVTVRPPHTS